MHVVFDRYDIPNSLKEGTRQKGTGTSRAVVYKITVDAVIDKITMKDLLSCSQNKETLAIFLAAQLIECKKGSQTTYVVTSKGDCMASNSLPIQHLRSEQEEADTRMLLHARRHTERSNVHNHLESRCRRTRSDALGLQETLSRHYSDCWNRRKTKKYSTRPTLRGGMRRTCEGFTWLSRFFRM